MKKYLLRLKNLFSALRKCLERNKIFFEVFSFLLLGCAGLYVSYNSYKISALEVRIHKTELAPTFKIELAEPVERTDNTEPGKLFTKNIKVFRIGGYADAVKCGVLTYMHVSKRTVGNNKDNIEVLGTMDVSNYRCENKFGIDGYVLCSGSVPVPFDSSLITGIGGSRKQLNISDSTCFNYVISYESILILEYLDVLNNQEKLYYDLNNGGEMITKQWYNSVYLNQCINRNGPAFPLELITLDEVKAIFDSANCKKPYVNI
jgi:hypothetical protein